MFFGMSMHFFADGSRVDVQRYGGLRRGVRGRTAQATVAVALCGAVMGVGAAASVSGLQPLRGSAGFYAARAMALRTLALRACRLCSGVWPEVSTVISALE